MNLRLARWMLTLYPSAWRDRYGLEVVRLSEELVSKGETTAARAGLNLIAGAAIEQGRALARSWRALLAPAAAVAIIIVAAAMFMVTRAGPGPATGHSARLTSVIGTPLVPVRHGTRTHLKARALRLPPRGTAP